MVGVEAELSRAFAAADAADLASFERNLRGAGYVYIAGVDEAGRGALAGPVVAGAVIFGPGYFNDGIADSKKLNPTTRERLWGEITADAVAWAVGVASSRFIDRVNVLNAALAAMKRACERLRPRPDLLLVDGNRPVPSVVLQKTIVGGDGKCASIAAASILAKVYRDRLMAFVDRKYPGYGFAGHKGYGTAAHLAAIAERGPSPVHRRTFRPFDLGPEGGGLFAA